MDNLIWIIYLIDTVLNTVGGLKVLLIVLTVISSIVLFGVFLHITLDMKGEGKREALNTFFKWFKKGYVPLFVSVLLLGLIPNKSTAYKMLAVYGVDELAQVEEVQNISEKSLKVIHKIMDEYLEEEEAE